MSDTRPTRAQFDFLQSFYRAIAAVGSALGSESSDAGLVIPTNADDLEEALAAITPATYRIHPLPFPDFVARYGLAATADPWRQGALEWLLDEVRVTRPSTAYVGTSKDFYPEERPRGTFLLALFANAKSKAGVNLLVLFPRVET